VAFYLVNRTRKNNQMTVGTIDTVDTGVTANSSATSSTSFQAVPTGYRFGIVIRLPWNGCYGENNVDVSLW